MCPTQADTQIQFYFQIMKEVLFNNGKATKKKTILLHKGRLRVYELERRTKKWNGN